MKKLLVSLMMLAVPGLNASAFFEGNINGTTGPGGYRGTKLDLAISAGDLTFEPMFATYDSNSLDKIYRTYTLRVAEDTGKCAVGAMVGGTPKTDAAYKVLGATYKDYSNEFAGADVTFTLTPGGDGHSRLAGPGAHGATGGGRGVSRIDVGASVKYTQHTEDIANTDKNTGQGEGSLFAGAKILMVNLSASYTGYKYGDTNAVPLINTIPGMNFPYAQFPTSSVNVRLDLPSQPLVTPFISYTAAKYRLGVKDSSAYLVGAYIDLNMVTANAGYQIFNNGYATSSYITLGAGVKFE